MDMTLSEKYMKELLDFHAKKTVGKILKRFEIIENRSVLKSDVKELLYESYRDLLDLLIAGGHGYDIKQFILKHQS